MLDSETKRRIDSARDILVGKVPDPKSQVEQITIALIYKFMDDMDQESLEMGGKASFFTGEFEKFGWRKIFDPHLGGYEMLALYAEAITRLNQNPSLPQLFRDIFKNAFLPYRDPETLKLFLKTINEFTYDHSERLGDAFEYLLSVLGSQGDAGQFRTPRHIIDFMVQALKPQKEELILDPACGTAGFLISAYKYILQDNQKERPGDLLDPQERKRLLSNFKGYDISPDMVRLSLVNLYLHGFVQPQIYEYDTLASEERWDEYADVILANPPFMSPKGGILPHKRFSVQSKRSEVLFVDYMAEHLTPNGRAAIIVPEGIVFQSGNAYKQLRKYLVEKDLLWAVVSLPSGVFNPYAGVKTSILFLDRALAKKSEQILFVKIEADGFDLGAQRKPVERNDLPNALAVLYNWKIAIQQGNPEVISDSEFTIDFLLVDKDRLAENGEFNLSIDRYRTAKKVRLKDTQVIALGEVCEINPKRGEVSGLPNSLMVSFVPMEDLTINRIYFTSNKERQKGDVYKAYTYFRDNDVILARVTPCFENGKSGIARNLVNGIGFGSSEYIVIRSGDRIIPEYVYQLICEKKFIRCGKQQMTGTGGLQRVPVGYVSGYQIPLPPLDIQRQIVEEIEGYQRIIDGARQVVEAWKPNIEFELTEISNSLHQNEFPTIALGEYCSFMTGGTPSSSIKEYYENGNIPWLVSGDLHKGEIYHCEGSITEKGVENSNAKYLPKDSVLIALNGQGKTRGMVALLRMEKATCNQSIGSINPNDRGKLIPEFLYYQLKAMYREIRDITGDNQRSGLNMSLLKSITIPLPPILIQKAIVDNIEVEKSTIEGNCELICRYEVKIQKVMERVWQA